MADVKDMEIVATPEQAQAVVGGAASKTWRRVIELEHALVIARDELRVVIGALEDFAQGETVLGMDEKEAGVVFGATWILQDVANACDKAVRVTE